MTAKDIRRLLEQCPSASVLQEIGVQAHRLGYRAAAVGGFVRDLLLGVDGSDIDIVVEGDAVLLAQAIAEQLKGELIKTSPFGTASVKVGNRSLDFATARAEKYPQPGALPSITPTSLEQDLYRRDFTINSLAVELLAGSFSSLLDPCGGVGDISKRKIRILHDESFHDDPTRMFRALRFATRLKFNFDTATAQRMQEEIRRQGWRNISSTRLMREIALILAEKDWIPILTALDTYGLFTPIFGCALTQDKINRLKQVDTGTDYFATQGMIVNRVILISLCLESYILLPAKAVRALIPFIEQIPSIMQELIVYSLPSKIYNALSQIPAPVLAYLWIICQNGEEHKHIRLYLEELRHISPGISTADIAVLVGRGPQVKIIYNTLLTAKLEGELPTLSDERELLERLAAETTHGGL